MKLKWNNRKKHITVKLFSAGSEIFTARDKSWALGGLRDSFLEPEAASLT